MKVMVIIAFLGSLSLPAMAQDGDFKSLSGKANELANAKEYKQALNYFDQALKLGTDDQDDMIWTATIAGTCALQANEQSKALAFFKIAIDRDCRDWDVYDNYIQIAEKQKDTKQQEYGLLAASRNVDGASKKYTQKLAYFYYNTKQYAKAIVAADSVLNTFPQRKEILNLKAISLEMTGRPDEAITAFESVLADHPDHQLAMSYLGIIYCNKGNEIYDAAKSKYVAIQKPTNEQYAAMKKRFDDAAVFYRKAVPLLEKAYKDNPTKTTKDALYRAYSRMGDSKKAAQYK